LLPALISYLALFYIVHLEAMKADIRGIPRAHPAPLRSRIVAILMTVSGMVLLAGAVYYGLGWIKAIAGDASPFVVGFLMLAVYLWALWFAAQQPELHMDDPNRPLETLPDAGPTLKAGLHFLLPVVALIWNLMVEELSPALSAFWATVFLMFIVVTQRPITASFRGAGDRADEMRRGFRDLRDGLVNGARNMIGIGIATATAGIIVGAVTLTGVGLVLTELVELISGGNLLLMLLLVAVICLILGMGLPTTANYIVVSTLMAPVVVELGAQSGLLVPLIAVHMFVFYFGLMADVTPPVGLASYAAAGIARTDPIRTGVTAFGYSIRTAILPFMFIFNTQLLLIDIDSAWHLLLTVAAAITANLVFAAASQGWFLARSRLWETALLLLVTFSLFRPGFWMDMIHPPYETVSATRIMEIAEQAPAGARLRVWVEGEDIEARKVSKGVLLPLGERQAARKRFDAIGLRLLPTADGADVIAVKFGSRAEKLGIEQGYRISAIEIAATRPAKEWIFLPALAVLALVVVVQLRRARGGGRPGVTSTQGPSP
jgi:TRAP transporter 4TM/12TM fusion protein